MNNSDATLMDSKALPIPMIGRELSKIEFDKFYLAEHEYAIVFHVYNSMDLIIRPNIKSTYGMLLDIIKNKDEYEKLEGEERENFETALSAVTQILCLPLYAFSDTTFTYDLAYFAIHYLNEKFDAALNVPLQEETPKENAEFEAATLELEAVKDSLDALLGMNK